MARLRQEEVRRRQRAPRLRLAPVGDQGAQLDVATLGGLYQGGGGALRRGSSRQGGIAREVLSHRVGIAESGEGCLGCGELSSLLGTLNKGDC